MSAKGRLHDRRLQSDRTPVLRLNALYLGSNIMQKKVWQAPQVQTTPVSMEVTTYLPAQA